MNKNLLILGAGQYGTVAKETAQSMSCFEDIAFLDDGYGTDNPNYHEDSIGKLNDYDKFADKYSYAIVAIGNPNVRKEYIEKLRETCFIIPNLISPKAYVSPSASLQSGCIIEPMAVVHANVSVGTGTFISAGAVLNHNSMVMDYCHIDCGAVVMSGAVVGSFQKIPVGETVRRVTSEERTEMFIDSVFTQTK